MGYEEWQTYCPNCQRVTLGRKETPNHLLHFLITVLTCGLWIFAWGVEIVWGWYRPYLCTICGAKGINR